MRKKFIITVDLGGTNLKVALLNAKCAILSKEYFATEKFSGREALIRAITGAVDDMILSRRINKSAVLGIGVGVPGPVNYSCGIVHFFPNIPGWSEVPLRKILEERLGLPVLVDNDAKLMCLGEHRLGNARKSENALCITLGTGIGGGLIIGGELFRGKDNAAGEFGHLAVNEDGPRCNCGGRGCLESYIGNRRLLQKARRIFGRTIKLEEISSRAKRGNKKALAFWKDAGIHLGAALASAVNLLNLDTVVIGGGVANAGEIFFKEARRAVSRRAMRVQGRRVKIVRAGLGDDAGLIGAGLMVKAEGLS